MKKLICTLISLALMVSLTACTPEKAPETSPDVVSDDTNDTELDGTVEWPTSPIEAVLTASAGGDTDFNARVFSKYFEQITGQPMIVTNMAGGGGTIATSNIKDSENDGSKVLFCHTGQLIVNKVAGLIDYDYTAFEVACIPAINSSYVLVASKDSEIVSVEDMIAKAKAKPNEVIYGTELGGYTHLQSLQLEKLSDIDLKIVDTGSASEKITSLLGGRIDLAAIPYGSAVEYSQTGDMVILAQYGEERNEYLGDIPTLKEKGIDLVDVIPYIISFPEGTDPAIVARMSEIALEIAEIPEYAQEIKDGYKQKVETMGTEDAIAYLDETSQRYSEYTDLLAGE